jgi:N-ethylmaleimide reductase
MQTLFDPLQAGELLLPNRIVMAPLTRNRAPDAVPTPLMAQYYAQRADAGLLITEATAISHQGQGYADVPGLYGTEQLDGWKKVTDAVHAKDGRIVWSWIGTAKAVFCMVAAGLAGTISLRPGVL